MLLVRVRVCVRVHRPRIYIYIRRAGTRCARNEIVVTTLISTNNIQSIPSHEILEILSPCPSIFDFEFLILFSFFFTILPFDSTFHHGKNQNFGFLSRKAVSGFVLSFFQFAKRTASALPLAPSVRSHRPRKYHFLQPPYPVLAKTLFFLLRIWFSRELSIRKFVGRMIIRNLYFSMRF